MPDEFAHRVFTAIAFVVVHTTLADPVAVKSVTVAGTRFPVTLATQAGHPFDTRVVESDVQKLWATRRFDDIQVESTDGAIVFRVREARQMQLREIHIEPNNFGLHPKIAAGTPINALRAHEIAMEAQKRLNAEGYLHARVDATFVPVAPGKVDLRLTVHAGQPVDLKSVEFQGDPGLRVRELRSALRAARIRRVFPTIPGIWAGWRLFPAYYEPALDADLARLRSLYLSRGYRDANVRLGNVEIIGKSAKLDILVQSGPRYANSGTANLCSCLIAARRDAERRGILDFSATLDAALTAHVAEGPPYHVGRIEFTGNHLFSDSAVRRNMLLDEGAPLDRMLIRKSIARINHTGWFDPIGESAIAIQTDPAMGLADVTLRLTERQHRAWSISGPVGPLSIAGPLQASLSSRLPAWGSGLLELSTYTASFSLVAFAHPLLPFLAIASKSPVLPVLAVQRPFTPGEGCMSGFVIAPQLDWQRTALGYATTQIQQRLSPNTPEEELTVTVERPNTETTLICDPPRPRVANLRRGVGLCLRLLGTG
jgi:hypothetical protein